MAQHSTSLSFQCWAKLQSSSSTELDTDPARIWIRGLACLRFFHRHLSQARVPPLLQSQLRWLCTAQYEWNVLQWLGCLLARINQSISFSFLLSNAGPGNKTAHCNEGCPYHSILAGDANKQSCQGFSTIWPLRIRSCNPDCSLCLCQTVTKNADRCYRRA